MSKPLCDRCNDTGVWETGNNDLPCDCPAGKRAIFNVAGVSRPVTGEEVQRHFLNGSPEPRRDVVDAAPKNAAAAIGKFRLTAMQRRVETVEPPLLVWEVRIEDEAGVWYETFGSEHEKDVFLRGFKAGLEMAGRHDLTTRDWNTIYFKDR